MAPPRTPQVLETKNREALDRAARFLRDGLGRARARLPLAVPALDEEIAAVQVRVRAAVPPRARPLRVASATRLPVPPPLRPICSPACEADAQVASATCPSCRSRRARPSLPRSRHGPPPPLQAP